jgi:acyl-coenzyme A synthetase/AMP-(fatty) acid ligase
MRGVTGDLVTMDEIGQVVIVDRNKDMVSTAGFKVFPAEIERVVAAHDAVAMVAVGSQPGELKGEVPKAYVVLKPGAKADADSIPELSARNSQRTWFHAPFSSSSRRRHQYRHLPCRPRRAGRQRHRV